MRRPTHAGRTDSDKIFPLPPKIKIPNLHIVRYTCQFEQYLFHRQNESHAHPSWAPTKEPTVSCWRYYSNKPQLLRAEVVLCMHKTTILCQFGLFCHQLTTISPPILSHFWWELYQINKSHRLTPKLTSQIILSEEEDSERSHAHPSWAPTKEPTVSCWRYYSNKPQLLRAEVVLCMHKTTILCQFGLFCHQLTTISPPILSHFWWELYQINKSHRLTPKLTSQIILSEEEDSQSEQELIV